MIFISAPYTHENVEVVEKRVEIIEKYVAECALSEIIALSPVLYYHNIVKKYELPKTYTYWEHICISMLQKCDMLFVLTMDGWDTSVGVKSELEVARRLNISIGYVNRYDGTVV